MADDVCIYSLLQTGYSEGSGNISVLNLFLPAVLNGCSIWVKKELIDINVGGVPRCAADIINSDE